MPQLHADWPHSTNPFNPRDEQDNPPEGSVGIVIPVKDGIKFFRMCFYSVRAFTDHPHLLTVIDNQSRFDTRNALKSMWKNHRDFNVLRYDDDFNFAAQVNLGLRHAFQWPTVKYGLILNADAVVGPEWLSNMVKVLNSGPRIGIVGPVTNKANPEQMDLSLRDQCTDVRRVSGFCMLFRREVFEQLGGFDETFEGGGFEDWDFCQRAQDKHWRVVLDGYTHVHHYYRAFRREDHKDEMLVNQNRFFAKHPGLLDAVQAVNT